MHVTVREVRISSESETSYFLRVEWRGRDLGSGFLLLLTDGLNAWRGEVSEDGVREEAEELEMQTDRYIQDLQQALTGTEPSSTDYSFTLTYNPGPVTNMTLAYEKVQRDISFRLGSVLLCKIPEPVEEVRALLTHGLERGTALQNHNHLLKEENHRLKQELQHINAELQRYVSGKETLESELYSRFILVLNEKKAKIRSLQENLTHLQETREEGESSSPGKGTKKTTGQTREEEDEYEASTDEDQSQPASLEPTQGTSRSRSPLDDSLNDITDVAPCRKRRFRHLQPPDTVAKRPTLEPAQKQRRDPLPSSRAAANQDQAPQLPDVSPDAEDLFEDI